MRPERFCISPTHWSSKFKSWIRLLCKTVGMLVPWLPKESVIETKSKFFKTADHGKLVHNWLLWSFHRKLMLNLLLSRTINFIAIKILISITSTGFVTFLSDKYGGRTSHKFICIESGFFDFLDSHDEVIADRWFQVTEEFMLKYCTLSLPPGA